MLRSDGEKSFEPYASWLRDYARVLEIGILLLSLPESVISRDSLAALRCNLEDFGETQQLEPEGRYGHMRLYRYCLAQPKVVKVLDAAD